MFTPRTTPVTKGEMPYRWDVDSIYQCTWFGYYRCIEAGFSPPVYWDRKTKQGSYPNAKQWLENFREPWQVKDTDYIPKAGDIIVYDGNYGHIIFMETDVMTSEYRNGDENSFILGKYGDYKGTLLGFLHYPYEPVPTVERNANTDQIETTDELLRIRNKPSLTGDITGYVSLGYYNVLGTKEADGYRWFRIAKDRWCADITVNYLPKENTDFIDEIRRWSEAMIQKSKDDEQTISQLKERLATIRGLTDEY